MDILPPRLARRLLYIPRRVLQEYPLTIRICGVPTYPKISLSRIRRSLHRWAPPRLDVPCVREILHVPSWGPEGPETGDDGYLFVCSVGLELVSSRVILRWRGIRLLFIYTDILPTLEQHS